MYEALITVPVSKHLVTGSFYYDTYLVLYSVNYSLLCCLLILLNNGWKRYPHVVDKEIEMFRNVPKIMKLASG